MKRMFEADLLDEQRRMQAFRAFARENIPEARRASCWACPLEKVGCSSSRTAWMDACKSS